MLSIRKLFYCTKVIFFLLFTVTFIVGGLLYLNTSLRIHIIKSIFNESNLKITYDTNIQQPQHNFVQKKNRQWILKQRPTDELKKEIFEFRIEDRPTITQGQVLVGHTHFSFDPTQKFWMHRDTYKKATPLGSPIEAITIGVVVESQHPSYEVGDVVSGMGTWQDYAVYDPSEAKAIVEDDVSPILTVIPEGISPFVFLTLPTDLTAIAGMLRVGHIKSGDKVLVSGAAGATGSVAGQVAKLLGASLVVGIAGGKEKKQLLTSQFKFDIAIDYKSEDVQKRVNEIFGKTGGIDVYFDNVGGEILNVALGNISHGGRVVLCGAISQYNTGLENIYLPNYFNLVFKGASMEGFIVLNYISDPGVIFRWLYWQATQQLFRRLHVQKNFDNLPDTLIGLYQGSNIGKLVLENDV
eukprot:TRINITY_DN1753_c0_g1_i1.p1 TRINITY_DN1753_c0_g1~~TRINITY_DN1753_c0_g1_i1.p1  ORF type:complete len:410 (-),score=82.16 TRINITY_DN1753_c0_g1_i1:138-1367(-)